MRRPMSQTSSPRIQPKPLIVVVEDQPELAALVATHLERAEMNAQICHRGQHALRFLQRNFANLALLDINLPDQSGFELAQQLKAADISVPIIFLTGNAEEESKVRGLELGGDDYVTKPFSYAELLARIRAVLRRTEVKADLNITKNVKVNHDPFEFCGARVQPQRLEVSFPSGVNATIGRKELGILAHLNSSAGQIVPRPALIHAVWGVHADVRSRSLDQYVAKIRQLFSDHGMSLEQFRTVHGVGYIFDPKGESEVGR